LALDHFEQVVLGDVGHLPAGVVHGEWRSDQAVVLVKLSAGRFSLFLKLFVHLQGHLLRMCLLSLEAFDFLDELLFLE
jgi:hypothetical protein